MIDGEVARVPPKEGVLRVVISKSGVSEGRLKRESL